MRRRDSVVIREIVRGNAADAKSIDAPPDYYYAKTAVITHSHI